MHPIIEEFHKEYDKKKERATSYEPELEIVEKVKKKFSDTFKDIDISLGLEVSSIQGVMIKFSKVSEAPTQYIPPP